MRELEQNMKKIIGSLICFMLLLLFLQTVTAKNSFNNSGPELETHIISGFSFLLVEIHVENIGDTTAHNVKLTDIVIEGNVILNFQESKIWSVDLEPGEWTFLDPNSMTIGFGKFTISMTVKCDEGASSTSSVSGLIFGPLIFIP